jgi:hypothetical protein
MRLQAVSNASPDQNSGAVAGDLLLVIQPSFRDEDQGVSSPERIRFLLQAAGMADWISH